MGCSIFFKYYLNYVYINFIKYIVLGYFKTNFNIMIYIISYYVIFILKLSCDNI